MQYPLDYVAPTDFMLKRFHCVYQYRMFHHCQLSHPTKLLSDVAPHLTWNTSYHQLFLYISTFICHTNMIQYIYKHIIQNTWLETHWHLHIDYIFVIHHSSVVHIKAEMIHSSVVLITEVINWTSFPLLINWLMQDISLYFHLVSLRWY